MHAAADLDPLGVDPAEVVGEQPGDHRPDVLRQAGAPASLGWLTMFILLAIVASFIVLGRRKLLTL